MKPREILGAILLSVSLAIAPIATTSCSTSGKNIVYNSIYSVAKGVNAAHDAYLDQVVQGKVSDGGVPKVAKAYNDFNAGLTVAIASAQFNWSAPASTDLTSLASAVLAAIAEVTKK